MNTRIYWNTLENLRMKQWIDANMPPLAADVQKVNAAQLACLGADRQRNISTPFLAAAAMKRMQDASTSSVPAGAIGLPVIHVGPSVTSVTMTAAELAKFGSALAKGTQVIIA